MKPSDSVVAVEVAESAAVRPFANGCQFMDWLDKNCCNCTRYSWAKDASGETRPALEEGQECQIELALHGAAWGDGKVSREIARRMGYTNTLKYGWRCGELDPTDEAKRKWPEVFAGLAETPPATATGENVK